MKNKIIDNKSQSTQQNTNIEMTFLKELLAISKEVSNKIKEEQEEKMKGNNKSFAPGADAWASKAKILLNEKDGKLLKELAGKLNKDFLPQLNAILTLNDPESIENFAKINKDLLISAWGKELYEEEVKQSLALFMDAKISYPDDKKQVASQTRKEIYTTICNKEKKQEPLTTEETQFKKTVELKRRDNESACLGSIMAKVKILCDTLYSEYMKTAAGIEDKAQQEVKNTLATTATDGKKRLEKTLNEVNKSFSKKTFFGLGAKKPPNLKQLKTLLEQAEKTLQEELGATFFNNIELISLYLSSLEEINPLYKENSVEKNFVKEKITPWQKELSETNTAEENWKKEKRDFSKNYEECIKAGDIGKIDDLLKQVDSRRKEIDKKQKTGEEKGKSTLEMGTYLWTISEHLERDLYTHYQEKKQQLQQEQGEKAESPELQQEEAKEKISTWIKFYNKTKNANLSKTSKEELRKDVLDIIRNIATTLANSLALESASTKNDKTTTQQQIETVKQRLLQADSLLDLFGKDFNTAFQLTASEEIEQIKQVKKPLEDKKILLKNNTEELAETLHKQIIIELSSIIKKEPQQTKIKLVLLGEKSISATITAETPQSAKRKALGQISLTGLTSQATSEIKAKIIAEQKKLFTEERKLLQEKLGKCFADTLTVDKNNSIHQEQTLKQIIGEWEIYAKQREEFNKKLSEPSKQLENSENKTEEDEEQKVTLLVEKLKIREKILEKINILNEKINADKTSIDDTKKLSTFVKECSSLVSDISSLKEMGKKQNKEEFRSFLEQIIKFFVIPDSTALQTAKDWASACETIDPKKAKELLDSKTSHDGLLNFNDCFNITPCLQTILNKKLSATKTQTAETFITLADQPFAKLEQAGTMLQKIEGYKKICENNKEQLETLIKEDEIKNNPDLLKKCNEAIVKYTAKSANLEIIAQQIKLLNKFRSQEKSDKNTAQQNPSILTGEFVALAVNELLNSCDKNDAETLKFANAALNTLHKEEKSNIKTVDIQTIFSLAVNKMTMQAMRPKSTTSDATTQADNEKKINFIRETYKKIDEAFYRVSGKNLTAKAEEQLHNKDESKEQTSSDTHILDRLIKAHSGIEAYDEKHEQHVLFKTILTAFLLFLIPIAGVVGSGFIILDYLKEGENLNKAKDKLVEEYKKLFENTESEGGAPQNLTMDNENYMKNE